MKQIAAASLVSLFLLSPAQAQDGEINDGMNLLSEGMKLLMEGLMKEVEPAMRELKDALGDLNSYHRPEVLPNGDILIRRKTPEELQPPQLDPPQEGEIDL